ncbi:response regulator transcription factor [Paenibacillus sp. JCM 10914]|uniref:response regulator transcription factor n=1 Tax=Paenibacillus sp. JCM 10914 TaxID=1236974 RepID=UPI0003CCB73A|nr:response regulator transcription factor [Paenibacillus sp. JCM 10914]GAE07966.1 two-component response regulator [Paenibacillus sp. JCM 10914]
MKHEANVLLVEDDKEIARIVCDHLRSEGYGVTWASTGREGWEDYKLSPYDIVLVDLMLPEVDGFTLCRSIRKESDVPILILSARLEDESKIRGLDLGADDYVTKPFSLEELSARIASHLRRYLRYQNQQDTDRDIHYAHGLRIDFLSKRVRLHEELLQLTAKEWDLLCLMANNPFEIFSKSALYEHVWQQPEDGNGNNTVTVHIKSLRAKLQDDTRSSTFIQTVWGVGYRFIGEVL